MCPLVLLTPFCTLCDAVEHENKNTLPQVKQVSRHKSVRGLLLLPPHQWCFYFGDCFLVRSKDELQRIWKMLPFRTDGKLLHLSIGAKPKQQQQKNKLNSSFFNLEAASDSRYIYLFILELLTVFYRLHQQSLSCYCHIVSFHNNWANLISLRIHKMYLKYQK